MRSPLQHRGPIARRLKLLGNINESALVAQAFWGTPTASRLMLDVGASRGSAFKHFLADDWRVIAFEPDHGTREKLSSRWASHANLTIESHALSDREGPRQFFHNDQYPGMSGFYAYESSHRSIGQVEATTLAKYCDAHGIEHVDFLKIDTEGEDLAVLRGVAWERLRPLVIEAEFAPGRSSAASTFEPIARLLVEQGYRVHVSEYAPFKVGDYRWLRFLRYPDQAPAPAGWGNILATRDSTIDRSLSTLMRVLTWPWRVSSSAPLSRLRRRLGSMT